MTTENEMPVESEIVPRKPKVPQSLVMVIVGLFVGVSFGVVLMMMPEVDMKKAAAARKKREAKSSWGQFFGYDSKSKRRRGSGMNRRHVETIRYPVFSHEMQGASMSDYNSL